MGELGPLTISQLAKVLEVTPQVAGKHVRRIHKQGYLLRGDGLLGLPDLSNLTEQQVDLPPPKTVSAAEPARDAWKNAATIATVGLEWDHPDRGGRKPASDFPAAARAAGRFDLAAEVEAALRNDAAKDYGDEWVF
ncbi:hypothetical protein [Shimia sp. MIT1388]|uniref:hypothetical protein n=1 Tax=Shimia sp. MIT1388 TaxID=3096992 RepID=UPI00399A232A